MALAPKFRNWLRTLGAPEDPVATDTTSEWSAMSLLKAIYAALANGTFVSTITFIAESYALQANRAVALTANYLKLTRASRIAAAASAVSAAADAVIAKDAANLVSGNAMLGQRVKNDRAAAAASAAAAAALVSGNAMLGQRTKKDRVAAAASAASAAASAASVPTPESLILPNQIFS
jgi:hypothetical protein